MTKRANDNMTSLHLIRNEASNWENLVVKYLCIQTVWTSQWHGRRLARTTRVTGSFALHIIFAWTLGGGGATV